MRVKLRTGRADDAENVWKKAVQRYWRGWISQCTHTDKMKEEASKNNQAIETKRGLGGEGAEENNTCWKN